jgi:hypothetical protein
MFDVWELWLVLEGPGIRKNLQVNYCRDVEVIEKNYRGQGRKHVRTDKSWCGPFTYNLQHHCIRGGDRVALDLGFRQNHWGQRPEGGENYDVVFYDTFHIQCRKARASHRGRTTVEVQNWIPDWEIDWDHLAANDERGRSASTWQFWEDRANFERTIPERTYDILPDLSIDDEPEYQLPLRPAEPVVVRSSQPKAYILNGNKWEPLQ